MLKRRIGMLAAGLIGLGACASAARPPTASPVTKPAESLRLVDLTAKFNQVASETAGLDDKAKVAAFEKAMAGVADGFYARSRKPDRYDTRVLKNLAAYPAQRAAILAVGHDFQQLLVPARASFEATFGPVHSDQPIYLLHSLGEMDGGTRDLGGKTTLIFGADMIARIHAGHDMTPFFHHELFHVLHEPRFGECEPLWCDLWEEGLATYVAGSLNPGAGDGALLLDMPAPIRPPVDANRAAAVCAVAPLLDSTKEDDYAALFYSSSHLPNFPARMGYYIGYLVAAELGKTRSLRQLAEFNPAEVRPLIDQGLTRLATCPKEKS